MRVILRPHAKAWRDLYESIRCSLGRRQRPRASLGHAAPGTRTDDSGSVSSRTSPWAQLHAQCVWETMHGPKLDRDVPHLVSFVREWYFLGTFAVRRKRAL